MAYADIAKQTVFFTLEQGNAIHVPIPTVDSTGANVDTSGYFNFKLIAFPAGGSGLGLPALSLSGVSGGNNFLGSSGTLMLKIRHSDAGNVPLGQYQFVLTCEPASGDDDQTIATGTMVIAPNN